MQYPVSIVMHKKPDRQQPAEIIVNNCVLHNYGDEGRSLVVGRCLLAKVAQGRRFTNYTLWYCTLDDDNVSSGTATRAVIKAAASVQSGSRHRRRIPDKR